MSANTFDVWWDRKVNVGVVGGGLFPGVTQSGPSEYQYLSSPELPIPWHEADTGGGRHPHC